MITYDYDFVVSVLLMASVNMVSLSDDGVAPVKSI